jgi:hypothetical protein
LGCSDGDRWKYWRKCGFRALSQKKARLFGGLDCLLDFVLVSLYRHLPYLLMQLSLDPPIFASLG